LHKIGIFLSKKGGSSRVYYSLVRKKLGILYRAFKSMGRNLGKYNANEKEHQFDFFSFHINLAILGNKKSIT
jgi:hypothetical protein